MVARPAGQGKGKGSVLECRHPQDSVALRLEAANGRRRLAVVRYAAVLMVTRTPARVARVMSISRLNFSHLPLTRSETRD